MFLFFDKIMRWRLYSIKVILLKNYEVETTIPHSHSSPRENVPKNVLYSVLKKMCRNLCNNVLDFVRECAIMFLKSFINNKKYT